MATGFVYTWTISSIVDYDLASSHAWNEMFGNENFIFLKKLMYSKIVELICEVWVGTSESMNTNKKKPY